LDATIGKASRSLPLRGLLNQSHRKRSGALCYLLTANSYYVQKDNVLDAIRIRDGIKVVLKRVSATTDEISITLHLTSAHMRSDPRNRTVHILDVIPIRYSDEEHVLLVMPYLREFDSPPFHCRSEFVEALRQLLLVCKLDSNTNYLHADRLSVGPRVHARTKLLTRVI
jgi:hypothetical protein